MPDALDRKFLDGLRGRKPEAIAEVVRRHAGDLLRAGLGLGLSQADAEELVQATFAAFLEASARFEGRSSVRTFLFGILYNKALEAGRKRSRELAVDPEDEVFESRFSAWGHWSPGPRGPEEEASAKEVARIIAGCLEKLPLQQRAAFQMKEIDHEESPAVCNALGVEDTHLRVLLFRARTRLRACIEGKWRGGS